MPRPSRIPGDVASEETLEARSWPGFRKGPEPDVTRADDAGGARSHHFFSMWFASHADPLGHACMQPRGRGALDRSG